MNFLKLNTSILGYLVVILSLSIFFISCEKTDDVTDATAIQAEEGNRSTTNNAQEISIDENTEVLKPIMYKSFDGDLSKEEVEVKWKKEVKTFIEKYKLENPQIVERGFSTELFFDIYTRTGCQTNNNTDGDAYARFNFRSNNGTRTTSWYELDNFGDDREKCDWDIYLMRRDGLSGEVITYAEARWAQLALKGTDGWFPTDFDIHIHNSDQTVSATGASHIYSAPNTWLDSSSSGAWDYYSTGTIGFGRLSF